MQSPPHNYLCYAGASRSVHHATRRRSSRWECEQLLGFQASNRQQVYAGAPHASGLLQRRLDKPQRARPALPRLMSHQTSLELI